MAPLWRFGLDCIDFMNSLLVIFHAKGIDCWKIHMFIIVGTTHRAHTKSSATRWKNDHTIDTNKSEIWLVIQVCYPDYNYNFDLTLTQPFKVFKPPQVKSEKFKGYNCIQLAKSVNSMPKDFVQTWPAYSKTKKWKHILILGLILTAEHNKYPEFWLAQIYYVRPSKSDYVFHFCLCVEIRLKITPICKEDSSAHRFSFNKEI